MKVIIAYICVSGGPKTNDLLYRFRTTEWAYPGDSDVPARIVLVCNGGPLAPECRNWIGADWSIYPRRNEGGDIGGFIDVARELQPDFLVCFGESVYFHRRGWLKRLIDSRNTFGEGMYGMLSSNLVRPHLNTTAFAVDAKLLAAYSDQVKTRDDRYQFEHGTLAFWSRVKAMRKVVCLVTFDGCYGPTEWRAPANIMWKGDQSNCLVWCSHTERYAQANAETKRRWEHNANCGV